jgi:hypothetical protein
VGEKLGEPIRAVVYANEGFHAEVPEDLQHKMIPFSDVAEVSKDLRIFVDLEYGIQKNAYRSYRQWRVIVQNGVVFRTIQSEVGD